ncbi:MAG: CHC2 zinc finger domain-containing protein [Candidatus Paceibacterota bacterium]
MSDAVQQIKDRLNIIDVVTPYVELHKAGRHFKGKSPFANEKTPSFYVSPERGMYYCFSTSQGGDIFTFIQTMEGVDFKGALKILAEKAKVELVPVSPEKQNEKDRLYSVLEEATHFYQTKLKADKGATEYLKKRGVSEESVASWRIGFAPGPPEAGWRETKLHLTGKGFTSTELAKAGLIKGSEAGKEPYDVFRNRVMFPLFDQGGRVVAFSGRT